MTMPVPTNNTNRVSKTIPVVKKKKTPVVKKKIPVIYKKVVGEHKRGVIE